MTFPIIWICLVPVFLDLSVTFYQIICFPIYGMPKVKRSEYIIIDRHSLQYLNIIEKLNCSYCGYFNGLIAYIQEIAARTEQYWCPIKHARKLAAIHSRYHKFLEYGDCKDYQERLAALRKDLTDLQWKTFSSPAHVMVPVEFTPTSSVAATRPSKFNYNDRGDCFFGRPQHPKSPEWKRIRLLLPDRYVDLIDQRPESAFNEHPWKTTRPRQWFRDHIHPLRTGYLYYTFYLQFLFVAFPSLSVHRYFKQMEWRDNFIAG